MSKIHQVRSPHQTEWATVSEQDYMQSGFEKRIVVIQPVKTNYLALSWSVSRGRDTHGYNICRLDDRATDQRFKCMGGGYDMLGTVVAQWLTANYQARLLEIAEQAHTKRGTDAAPGPLYGMTYHADAKRIYVYGACGLSSVEQIARAIGIRITSNYNNRKRATDGYFVTDFGSADALRAAELEG